MAADRSEQPRAFPDAVPDDLESAEDGEAVYLVPFGQCADIAAAEELLRALPGVSGVSVDTDDRSIMVWGNRAMLSEQELAAAMETASADLPESVGE